MSEVCSVRINTSVKLLRDVDLGDHLCTLLTAVLPLSRLQRKFTIHRSIEFNGNTWGNLKIDYVCATIEKFGLYPINKDALDIRR